jgi:hypothetical protein
MTDVFYHLTGPPTKQVDPSDDSIETEPGVRIKYLFVLEYSDLLV